MASKTEQLQSTTQDLREGINVMLEDTKSRIMETADKLEDQYISPLKEQTKSFATSHPILALFLTAFVVFSILPVLTFISFVFIACGFVLGLGLAVMFFSIAGIIFFAGVVLFPFMILATFLALSTTATLLALFALHRLYLQYRASDSNPSVAFSKWVDEMKMHVGLVKVTQVALVNESEEEGLGEMLVLQAGDVKDEDGDGQLVEYVDSKVGHGHDDEGSDEGVIVSPKNGEAILH